MPDWPEILNRLADRSVSEDTPCPICGNPDWHTIPRWAILQVLRDDRHQLVDPYRDAQSLHVAVVVCANCGFLRSHLAGVLGLTADALDTLPLGPLPPLDEEG